MSRNLPVPHYKWAKHKHEHKPEPVCDCQHPEPTPDGFAAVSFGCEIHNYLTEADIRTQRWLAELGE